ncbi:MAG: methyltransferase domain-containing protein [Planctomycetota bacterium]
MKHGTRVASVAPSSRFLSAATARFVDATKPQTIVELGAGTGPVTAEILRRMHPDSRLLALELDDDFAAVLRQRFGDDPRATLVTGSATDLDQHLNEARLGRVDVFINGLPTPSLPEVVVDSVMRMFATRATDDHVPMSQITEMPWVYQGLYRRMFLEVDFQFVLKNIPPGGVYHCRGVHPDYAEKLDL